METTKKSLLKSYFSALRYLLIILMFKLRARIRKKIEKKLYAGDEMIEYSLIILMFKLCARTGREEREDRGGVENDNR